ncbi:DUF1553 domain-containing protein [Saccharobesus litoralis]
MFSTLLAQHEQDKKQRSIKPFGHWQQAKKTEEGKLTPSLQAFDTLAGITIAKPLTGFEQWLTKLRKFANSSANTTNISNEKDNDKSLWQPVHIDSLQTANASANLEDNSIVRSDWIKPTQPEQYVIQSNGKFPNQISALQFDFLSEEQDPTKNWAAKNVPFAIKQLTVSVTRPNGKSEQSQVEYQVQTDQLKSLDLGYYMIPRAGLEVNYRHEYNLASRKNLLGKDMVLFLEKPLNWQAGDKVEIKLDLTWQYGVENIGAAILPSTKIKATHAQYLGPLPDEILALANQAKHTELETEYLTKYYNLYSQPAVALERKVVSGDVELVKLGKQLPRTWITKTRKEPRQTRVLPRGDWMDETGEIVTPAIPEFLGKLDINDRRANRLDLANWLVSADNPLTARVTVNRLWKKFYGIGLSKVLDDVGSQGEWPTHPELLDWLAVEFIESGWDIKHMVRLMVTSATYRQSSIVDSKTRQKDTQNRYFARQAQVRLPAEILRDNALAIAGLLDNQIGGSSVRPYQPAGYLSDLEFPKRYWRTEQDNQQYRRGLYTFWQRTRLHPMLQTFDAPARSEGHADRVVSNTPLQALTLLNDPSFVEAARVFASHIMQQPGTTESKIDWALQTALARTSQSQQERNTLVEAYQTNLDYFTQTPHEASALLDQGNQANPQNLEQNQLAAWTSVARIILNLHETVTRL